MTSQLLIERDESAWAEALEIMTAALTDARHRPKNPITLRKAEIADVISCAVCALLRNDAAALRKINRSTKGFLRRAVIFEAKHFIDVRTRIREREIIEDPSVMTRKLDAWLMESMN